MKVSIVIPVYNEAENLAACLQAIARQTVAPYEVIVVDNNSTDGTTEVAERFPFVRLLNEPKQGVVYARTRGFDAARGAIIGRIDADTLLPPDWVEQITEYFADPRVAAVSGAPDYYDFALSGLVNSIDQYLRFRLANRLADRNFLWGANMAMRRTAWHRVRSRLCHKSHLHEDFDLGIHLQEAGLTVAYNPDLVASVSSRRIDTSFGSFIRYTLISPKTYADHRILRRVWMYPVLLFCWLAYFPGRLIYKAYDHEQSTLSLKKLFMPTEGRVDPTRNVV